jgi:hypothetical protein
MESDRRAGIAAAVLAIALLGVTGSSPAQDVKPPAAPAAEPPADSGAPSGAPPPDSGAPSAPSPAGSSAPPAGNPAANAPAPETVLNKNKVQGTLGKDVRSSSGEDMGRIVDVIVDRAGGPRAAVIDFGGFLGVGSRKIAVDWNALHFAPDGDSSQVITLDLTRDQVKAAPEYTDKKPIVVLGASGSTQPIPDDESATQPAQPAQ